MNKISNLLWGVILIVVGVIFGLNTLEITNINVFFDGWWTLFIIVPCFVDLFKEQDKSGNIIGLIIGICLFLGCQDFISFELIFKLLMPFIIVSIGVSLLVKGIIKNETTKKVEIKEDLKEVYATFSSEKLNYNDELFEGIDVNAIFGGVELDLSSANIKEDAVINATAVFGGIDVIVPEEVSVKVVSTSIFGGVSDKVKNTKNSKVTIYINATCIFGGVEIK